MMITQQENYAASIHDKLKIDVQCIIMCSSNQNKCYEFQLSECDFLYYSLFDRSCNMHEVGNDIELFSYACLAGLFK